MKFLFTCMCLSLFWTSHAQDNSLQTKSVSINDFISFVINLVPSLNKQEKLNESETIQNFTFLIETKQTHLSDEEVTILQQGFKILYSKLGEKDTVSISVYGIHNGLLLSQNSHLELKKILHSVTNLQKSIVKPYNEAIGETFAHASSIANKSTESTKNSLVFLTSDYNGLKQHQLVTKQNFASNSNEQALKTTKEKTEIPEKSSSKNGSVVLLTAMTLLPELIQIIKD